MLPSDPHLLLESASLSSIPGTYESLPGHMAVPPLSLRSPSHFLYVKILHFLCFRCPCPSGERYS